METGETEGEEFLLGELGVAGEFARDVDGCAAGDEVEDAGGDEFVGQDYIRAEDGFVCCSCQ